MRMYENKEQGREKNGLAERTCNGRTEKNSIKWNLVICCAYSSSLKIYATKIRVGGHVEYMGFALIIVIGVPNL
jgi:hypothetical protein